MSQSLFRFLLILTFLCCFYSNENPETNYHYFDKVLEKVIIKSKLDKTLLDKLYLQITKLSSDDIVKYFTGN